MSMGGIIETVEMMIVPAGISALNNHTFYEQQEKSNIIAVNLNASKFSFSKLLRGRLSRALEGRHF